MELLFKACSVKLLFELLHGSIVQKLPFEPVSKAFVWNCRAKLDLQSYLSSWDIDLYFHNAAVCSWVMAGVLGAVLAMLGVGKSVYPCCCVQLSWTSCLAKLFLKLLHGTVVRKCFTSFCMQLSGKGLGRRLSYVGHNQISLFMVLHAALVHKLPCEAVS